MDQSELLSSKQAIEKSYGPWTAHNFSLGQDVFTIANKITGDEVKLRRVLQVVADVCNSPIDQLRVLDLACLEGMYAIEFARKGARVCAIEGREANLEKARFAARALSLDAVEFFQDDVRNLTEEKYGKFDVVLCLGILYHLDAPDLFDFLERVYSVSRRVVVIDTHVSLHPEHALSYRGRAYWGATVPEHTPDSSLEERRDAL